MSAAAITLRRLCLESCFFVALGLTLVPAEVSLAESRHAAGFCAQVENIAGQAGSNFRAWKSQARGTGMLPKLSGAEDCAVTQSLSGVKTYHCTWAFPYRAEGAYRGFDAFNASLKGCFGGAASVSGDQRVNHPDFYDRQLYQLGQVEVAVSIKDKTALQKTYLFLRVRGAEPD